LGCNSNDWLATVAARLGWTIDHALLYLKGGGAWVHDKHEITCTPFDGCGSGGPPVLFASDGGTVFSGSRTRAGWMFGAGVEYAFTPNWSAKIEYDYMDFGTARVNLGTGPALISCRTGAPLHECDSLPVDIKQRLHLVKAGVNYRFWWGKAPFGKSPVVASY
jgi:outer membrane immunogenic protein